MKYAISLLIVLMIGVTVYGAAAIVTESSGTVAYTIPLSPVTELDIGWPPIAHLSWKKGYLEFKSQQPTKSAKEFFNVYLKDLVDSYIASHSKECQSEKEKRRHS